MRSDQWSPRSRELTLPERVAWILGHENGRPLATLTEPSGLLVAAATVELMLDASLLDAGAAFRRGPVEPVDPLLTWVLDGLVADGGFKHDLGRAVTGPRGAQMIRRTMDRLVERGLAHREPRRVFGYLAMPVFGSALRVHEIDALHHDRAAVRAVLDGAEPDEDLSMIALLLHHGRRVRTLAPRDVIHAEARAQEIATGEHAPLGVDDDIRRLASPIAALVLDALTASTSLRPSA